MPIISLTTIPSRIHLIKPCINSLKQQGLKVYLWIPKYFKRKKMKFDGKIPNFLKHPNIVYEVVEDMGPITKLLPALQLQDDIIITADDDNVYGQKWARRLLNHANKYPKAALCYRGRVFRKPDNPRYQHTSVIQNVKKATPVDIITGVRGALYHKKFFNNTIHEFTKVPEAFFVDDIWISGKLAEKKIKRLCIPHVDTKVIHNLKNIDGLFKINWRRPGDGKKAAQHNNNTVINYFNKYW